MLSSNRKNDKSQSLARRKNREASNAEIPVAVSNRRKSTCIYLMQLHVAKPLHVIFSGSLRGQAVLVDVGEHLYVGTSSVSEQDLYCRIGTTGGNLQSEEGISAVWHEDRLLDNAFVKVVACDVVHGSPHLHSSLVKHLLSDDGVRLVFEAPMGAVNQLGHVQLLRVNTSDAWWFNLTDRIWQFVSRQLRK